MSAREGALQCSPGSPVDPSADAGRPCSCPKNESWSVHEMACIPVASRWCSQSDYTDRLDVHYDPVCTTDTYEQAFCNEVQSCHTSTPLNHYLRNKRDMTGERMTHSEQADARLPRNCSIPLPCPIHKETIPLAHVLGVIPLASRQLINARTSADVARRCQDAWWAPVLLHPLHLP